MVEYLALLLLIISYVSFRILFAALFLLLLASGSACSLYPEEGSTYVEYSESGAELASRLEGAWVYQTVVQTHCPTDFVAHPFHERLFWRAEKSKVFVSRTPADTDPLELSAINSRTLVSFKYVEWRSCTVYEDISITFDTLSPSYLRGSYKAYYHHNESELCFSLAEDYDLEESSCEVNVSFVARRN